MPAVLLECTGPVVGECLGHLRNHKERRVAGAEERGREVQELRPDCMGLLTALGPSGWGRETWCVCPADRCGLIGSR